MTEQNVIQAETQAVALTPADMISKALEQGSGVEVLTQLMGLQERYDATQARKAFDEAMSRAKAELPIIGKNNEVDFTGKTGIRTNYQYEDLAGIAKIVDPILSSHGLSYRFRTAQDATSITVTCVISHRDGHSEENGLTASADNSGNKNSIQAIASTVTYLERYTLKAGLGLAVSNDDDGKRADGPMVLNSSQAKLFINFDKIAQTIREMPTFKRLENLRNFIETIEFVHPSTVGIWLEECDARAAALDAELEGKAKANLTGEKPVDEDPHAVILAEAVRLFGSALTQEDVSEIDDNYASQLDGMENWDEYTAALDDARARIG